MAVKKVSVIIPCYNVASCFELIAEKVRSQTYGAIEYILIDDGSQDETGELLDGLAGNVPGIQVIHQDNLGVGLSRNPGLERATGDYILFWNADDRVEPDMVERMVEAAEAGGADYVICGFFMEIIKDEDHRWQFPYHWPEVMHLDSAGAIQEQAIPLMDASMLYNLWNKLFRTDIIQKEGIRFPRVPWGEDWDFNLNYLRHCRRVVVIPDCLYHYIRETPISLSCNWKKDFFEVKKGEYLRTLRNFHRLGILNEEGSEYLCRWFVERAMDCMEKEFSRDNPATPAQRLAHIRDILEDPLTGMALCGMRPSSMKMAVMAVPIRRRRVVLTAGMMRLIAGIRIGAPDLFYQLKTKR